MPRHEAAGFSDDSYRVAAARVDAGADVVLSVQPLTPHQVRRLVPGAVTISFLPVAQELEIVAGCCVTRAGEVRHAPTRELLEAEES